MRNTIFVKKVILVLLSVAVIVLLLSDSLISKPEVNREQMLSQIISTGLEHWHYSGKEIDDDFSVLAFNDLMGQLDFGKRFFLQGDIQELQKYKDKIDDEFTEGSTELLTFASKRFNLRLEQVMGFYQGILAKPFDFSKDETIVVEAKERPYCNNMDELKEYWRKSLKLQTLFRYTAMLKEAKKKGPDAKLEEKARKAVAKSFNRIFDRLKQTMQKDSLAIYLNALVQVLDPHTVYYPPLEKETFDMQMSGSFEGIGALLREDDGYVGIAEIIPGGPSWKQKQLQPGDKILKVAQGDDEPEDIVGMRVQDAVKLIRGKKGSVVKLTVKKPNSQIVVIPITRDVVVLEETFARSVVLMDGIPVKENKTKKEKKQESTNGKNNDKNNDKKNDKKNDKNKTKPPVLIKDKNSKRIGYIFLPKFYNDFSHRNGRNSTDDVKAELEKLKRLGVDGVILDLRSNGGGALTDAVRMSGLFIPKGPIVQVKDKQAGIHALRDTDPGTSFDGPLIVMVNTMSASASEILAAALQDYGRAIIVGSQHSFGKGTVQVMVNLDRFAEDRSENEKSLGALAITIQKFYRINGTSIQHKGVIPDVILPDRFAAIEIGEKHLDHSLAWDTIPTAEYQKWDALLPDPERNLLVEKSSQRVNHNKRFQYLKEFISNQKNQQEQKKQTLSLVKMQQKQEELRIERERFEKIMDKPCNIIIESSTPINKNQTEELIKVEKERQEDWFETVQKDLQLKEAMAIMTDMIRMYNRGNAAPGA